MSEANIRAQIKAIIETVTDIGLVHDYERWATDWTVFINLFKTQINGVDQIRGWEIGRKSYAETKAVIGPGASAHEGIHGMTITGYLGVKDADATEKTFNALIEAVATAFRTNRTLNGECKHHNLIQVELIDTRIFGSVLCHHADLTLAVTERI